MLEDKFSYIVVVDDLSQYEEDLKKTKAGSNLKLFFREDFLLEDAKEVLKEAYIAEANTKIIVLAAKSFNIFAQSSLLKILEEPPRNIKFIIAVTSKLALLPTVRSRLIIKNLKIKKDIVSSGLKFKNLDLHDIYDFVQKNKSMNKNDLKDLLQQNVIDALNESLRFTDSELKIFQNLFLLSSLYSSAQNLLTIQLLTILNRQYK